MIVKCKYGNYQVKLIVRGTQYSEGLYRLAEGNRIGWYGDILAIVKEIKRREKIKQEAAEWNRFQGLAELFIRRSRR